MFSNLSVISSSTLQGICKPSDPPAAAEQLNILEIAKTLLSKGDDNSVGPNNLVNAVLLQQLMKQQEEKTEPAPKPKPAPKEKSGEEKLWAQCAALGRKLDGMSNHSISIIKLTAEPENDWCWAQGQTFTLQAALDKAGPIVHTWSDLVRTSTLAKLLQKEGGPEKSITWLTQLKKDIETASTDIEGPLGMLVGMHNTMLRKKFADIKKPAKKAKVA